MPKKKHAVYLILGFIVASIVVLLSLNLFSESRQSRCEDIYQRWSTQPKPASDKAMKSELRAILAEWKGDERRKRFMRLCMKMPLLQLEKELRQGSEKTAPGSDSKQSD